MEIAAAVVALLAPYLARAGGVVAEQAGEAVSEKLRGLYEAVRRRFEADDDDEASAALGRFQEQPTDEARQAAVVTFVAEKARADPEFAETLRESVASVVADRAFVTQISGDARVGKIVNVGHARDLSF